MIQKKIAFTSEEMLETQRKFADKVFDLNKDFFEKNGRARVCYTHSYGCQQNKADEEKLRGQLADMGFSFTSEKEGADFILYNTCAVREGAEDRVFGNVGALKFMKRKNPELVIGLCGCMTQQEEVVKRLKKSFPFVSLIFGTHAMQNLPQLVHEVYTSGQTVIEIDDEIGYISEGLPTRRDEKLKAWVSIMYGCNNFCTYCIVPFVRGRERSRKSAEVLAEIRGLVADGYKEICLLGQNVNSYGNEREDEISFPRLLEEICEIEGDFRLRFMTSHPKDAGSELIDVIAKNKKIARHIHLPIQSGSNKILKLMNRGYTKESYLAIVKEAREKIEGISFSSDIIAGFPGETEEDFLETIALAKEIQFNGLFTFIYSKRSGTRAADFSDPVPYAEKSAWLRQIIEAQNIIIAADTKRLIGTEARVLIEARDENGLYTGKTDANANCKIKSEIDIRGKLLDIKLTGFDKWFFTAELI